MAAIRTILSRTTKHEIQVQDRFRLLQQYRAVEGFPIVIPDLLMTPVRVDIPVVLNGFVYLLVSLRDKSYQTCFVGETKRNLLEELGEHNAGGNTFLTSKPHFRPWSLAAFVTNFSCDEDRLNLKAEMEDSNFLKLRIDTMMDHLQNLCRSGNFGSNNFFKCGNLIHIPQ